MYIYITIHVAVPFQKNHMAKPNHQGDGSGRRDLWEVRGREGSSFMHGISILKKGMEEVDVPPCFFILLLCGDTAVAFSGGHSNKVSS
jgi:hypothetical protein